MKSTLDKILFKEISNAPLVVFRIAFGALMLFSTTRFMLKGWVTDFYVTPKFHFTYLGFDWIQPLSENGMYIIFSLIVTACICIILGYKYRFFAVLFFVLFTYVELIDKTFYLNHYYFVSLMAFLMCFLPANRRFSLDAKLNPSIRTSTTSAWHVRILMFQMGVVYFFAGVAKINTDWLLNAQPLKLWLNGRQDLSSILKQEWVAYFASWFGCIYDLLVPFGLLWKRTRPIAYFFVIAFHFITWMLFPIGVFPWVMMVGTLIFFSENFHEKILSRFESPIAKDTFVVKSNLKLVKVLIGAYILIQLALPFRYLLYPGVLYWTEEGYRFSWRVMLMEKHGHAQFYIKNNETNKFIEVNNEDFLEPRQEKQMATQPDFILQYAHHLKDIYKDSTFQFTDSSQTWNNIGVHAKIMVTLNGRPSQLFVDKKHDLTKYKYNLCHRKWIEPFNE